MDNKKWYQSKTIWLNVGAFVLTFIPMIQDYLSTNETITALAVLNILLRAITKTAISNVFTKESKKDET